MASKLLQTSSIVLAGGMVKASKRKSLYINVIYHFTAFINIFYVIIVWLQNKS